MKRHPNYQGGTIKASHGYMLRYVGKEHHLADVRGYAYEHRLVMEEKLGRRLRPREIVHHANEIKADNSPGNLVLKKTNGIHVSEHLRKRTDLKPIAAAINPIIQCACGCGETFKQYDDSNRPRKYVPGHQGRGKKHWWNHNSWSRLGKSALKKHLAKCRNKRWHPEVDGG